MHQGQLALFVLLEFLMDLSQLFVVKEHHFLLSLHQLVVIDYKNQECRQYQNIKPVQAGLLLFRLLSDFEVRDLLY